jgi:GNAT superfamily N-acetyltransferase
VTGGPVAGGPVAGGGVTDGDLTAPASGVQLRLYEPGDDEAIYDICVRTGDFGADARGKYTHADLLADVYAGPYLLFEPGLAFVLDVCGHPVGYVLGTADTARFVSRYRREWIPRLAGRYSQPSASLAGPDGELLASHHRPERMLTPFLDRYPAHLHVDILAPYQGAGHGRRLLDAFFRAAADAGAPGVHVGVARANTRAHGFYLRLGFHLLPTATAPDVPALYYGRALAAGP